MVRSRYYTEEPYPLFEYLDDIATILGTTKATFLPFLENEGSYLRMYGVGGLSITALASLFRPTDEAAVKNLEDEFEPFKHPGGVHSYYNRADTNNHIRLPADNAAHSFDDSGSNPFSLGAWVLLDEPAGSARTIIAKYGSTANAEEYDLRLDTSAQPVLELHDASESAAEIATSDDAITPKKWQFVVATYNSVGGASANAGIKLYINGAAVSAMTLTDAGTYVAMEDTATPLLIGARDVTGTPAQEFQGRLALPFITGKELSAAEVRALHRIERVLIGV